MSLVLALVLVLAVLCLCGGGYGYPTYGPLAWSPLGLLVAVAVLLLLTGYLR